jgi:hypothetical protein
MIGIIDQRDDPMSHREGNRGARDADRSARFKIIIPPSHCCSRSYPSSTFTADLDWR